MNHMSESLKNNFGVLILFAMFMILIGATIHVSHDKSDNDITEAFKINLAGVVGAITGLVTGSRNKSTERAGDVTNIGNTVTAAAPDPKVEVQGNS